VPTAGTVVAESRLRGRRSSAADELVPEREETLASPSWNWLWFAVAGMLCVNTWLLVEPSAGTQLAFYVGLVGLSFAAVVIGTTRNRGPARWSWWWIAGGLGCLLVSELVRVWFRYTNHQRFPNVADVLTIVAYGLFTVALTALVRRHEPVADRANLLDALIVTVALTALSWYVFIEPYASNSLLPNSTKALVIVRLIGWLLVLSLVVRLLFVVTRRAKSIVLLLVGLSVMVGSDMQLGVGGLARTYRHGGVADALSLAALVLIGAAALHPSSVLVRARRPHPTGRIRILSMLTVTLVCPVVLVAAGWSESRLAGLTLIAAVCAICAFGLVALRMWSLIAVERRTAALQGANRLGALVQNSKDGIFVVDRAGIISYASPGVRPMTGHDPDDLVGTSLATCFPREDGEVLVRQLVLASRQAPGASVEWQGRYVDGQGTRCDFEMTIANLLRNRDVEGIVVTMRDVTTRKRLEVELKQRALRDDLTGLANRALFMDRLEHALLRLQRAPSTIAVLFVDLDDFKAVNDGLGHAAGDALLVAVAERLERCLRPSDTIARLGGDEFAVLLDDVESRESAWQTSERLLETLQMPVPIGDLAVNVPASIGIAIADAPASPESLMRDADIALYRAKGAGKGRVAEFDTSMRWEAYERLRLRTELARVVEQNELMLLFQPIVSTKTDEIVGAEALLRWEHPKLGTIPPLDFIPIAEETGMIVTIGRWVLETACSAAAAWNRTHQREIYVSVNVSARQLRERDFADDVQRVLAETGLPGRQLMLELTETVLVDEVAAENLIERVVPLGVAIAIDDFGTGYSSLAYLQRFPVDVLKIDRSFVSNIQEEGMRAVVESIAAIADVMGYSSIAEGVETDAQLDGVLAFDYRYAQGYRYSRPVNAATLDRLLHADGARLHGRWSPIGPA
jgi:diguanylate cyclase (GGDEF)-like protein/PAS domain S-box-containing protein